MHSPILVINAGSSSIKFSVFETLPDRSLAAAAHGQVEGIGHALRLEVRDAQHRLTDGLPVAGSTHEHAVAAIRAWCAANISEADLAGVGHRIVHGGQKFIDPVLITDQLLGELDALVPLAPLHQPHSLAAVRALRGSMPGLAQIACFDTAFHSGQPLIAREFALPRELTARGVRRYGFHGLSYEFIVAAMATLAPDGAPRKLVVAHLGNGASMCAIEAGSSVACTMGFSTADGLPMGTRTGALDPGVILYLMQHERMTAPALEQLIYNRSGLLGVSGVSADMRTLLASREPGAAAAIALFVYWIGRELGSLAAALGGLDALVFTGGIGEHAAAIRTRVCRGARWLGVTLDEEANARGGPLISIPGSGPSVWVVPTDENLMIARHTRRLLDGAPVTAAGATVRGRTD